MRQPERSTRAATRAAAQHAALQDTVVYAARPSILPSAQWIAAPDWLNPAADTAAHIGALATAWDDLAAHASEPNPFAERWFVAAGLRHIASEHPIDLLFVSDAADALIGVMPITRHGRYGRLALTHTTNWQHANAFLGAPLVRAGCETAFWLGALAAVDAHPRRSGLLHFTGVVDRGPIHAGLRSGCATLGRACDTVLVERRAVLIPGGHTPESYWEAAVRPKKRKELRRQEARLSELGCVTHENGLAVNASIDDWIGEFLALESAGWKGDAGSALAGDTGKTAFFVTVVAAAFAAGRADLRTIRIDGRAIAMLVHIFAGDTAFSFKTAFDEGLARFSPGVLIQRDNLALIERPGLALIDSCAAPDHPMINRLWAERRCIIRVTIPLAGARNRARFAIVRAAETLWSRLRMATARRTPIITQDNAR